LFIETNALPLRQTTTSMNTTASTALPEVFAEVRAVDSGVAGDLRAVVGNAVDVDVAVKTQ